MHLPRTRSPRRGRRWLRRVCASALAVGLFAIGLPNALTPPPPAHAEAGHADSSVLGQGARPFFAYVRQGEYLWVETDEPTTYIRSHTGTEYAWQNGGKLYGPASADGVWSVYLATGDPDHPVGSWEIEARTGSSSASGVEGRVWTHRYFIRQTGGADAGAADLRYWLLNDTGYVYQVDLAGFRGINSTIEANALGNVTEPGVCESAYESVDSWSGREAIRNRCGDPHRIFFAPPAADLPETAQVDGEEVFVAPEPVTSALLNESELRFTPERAGAFAGTFSATVTPRFAGTFELEIDTDGDGDFDGDDDLRVPMFATGEGRYQYVWDGAGAAGEDLPAFGKRMHARIRFDRVGEMHIVQRDVEGREGIRVVQRTGENSGDATLHWDDRGLSTQNRASVTPRIDARSGVDSSGFVHGWEYDPGCAGPTEDCGSWGNNRGIADWVASEANGEARTGPFGGSAAIAITKTADPDRYAAAGEEIAYRFDVRNTGTLDLEHVYVTETSFTGSGTLTEPDCPAAALPVGGHMTCTASYTVAQADLERGTITNAATATGNPPGEEPVTSPPDETTVSAQQRPALSLVKHVENATTAAEAPGPGATFAAGDELRYHFTVTNSGNLRLANLRIDETRFTGDGGISEPVCAADSLEPGASTICAATADPATQGDADRGTIENTAVAVADAAAHAGVTSAPSSAVAAAEQVPAIHLDKLTDRDTFVAGDDIDYTFRVTNVGNVTLTAVSITEETFTGAGALGEAACPEDALPPGAATTCTATYRATQADLDRGEISNTATATGHPPTGNPVVSQPSSAVVAGAAAPALALDKGADVEEYVAGTDLTYTFVVRNRGNVSLDDVDVEELAFSGSGALGDLLCDGEGTLRPGQERRCTAAYTATQADLDAGSLDNRAVANATGPGGEPVTSNEDEAHLPGTQTPALRMDKAVDAERFSAGDTLTYTFTVTNTGNTTMHDVVVHEERFTGTGTLAMVDCPAAHAEGVSLAPEASLTCTATYVATLEDQGFGEDLHNVAYASGDAGDRPGGAPVRSNSDDAHASPRELPAGAKAVAAPLARTGSSGPEAAAIAATLAGTAGTLALAWVWQRSRRRRSGPHGRPES